MRTEPAAPFVAFDPGLLRLDTQTDAIVRSVSRGEQERGERGKEGQTPYAPALEIAGGYQGVQTGRHGWFASAARPLGDRFAIVVEFADASYRSAGGVSRKTGPWFAEDSHRYTYLGGVRYAFSDARVTPFVQALAGASTTSIRQELLYPGERDRRFTSTWHSGVHQVGAGVDISITKRIAARVTASALTVHRHGPYTRFKLTAGVVIGIGHR